MRRWMAIGIDRHVEQPDDDYEVREPACKECGGTEGDHDATCSYDPSFFDGPGWVYDTEDDPDAA